jgi:hypothetical protein
MILLRSGQIASDLVGRLGLEPRTHGLKVRCSTIELTPRENHASDLQLPVVVLLPSGQLALESASKSPKTIKSYIASVPPLAKCLRDHDMPDDIDKVGPDHLRAFLLAESERTSPAFAQQHCRNLHMEASHVRGVTKVPLPLMLCTSPSARSTPTALRAVWAGSVDMGLLTVPLAERRQAGLGVALPC